MTPIASLGGFIVGAVMLLFGSIMFLLGTDVRFEGLRESGADEISENIHNGGNAA